MKRTIRVLASLVFLVASVAFGAELKKPVTSIELNDGDTFVFLGDSITHQCLYTQYVEDYYYTRYPDRRIRFHNAGVSGDKATHALRRFDRDVAAFKPKYVTILLGMNDGTYRHFEHDIFAAYERDMVKLMDQLSELGTTTIAMGPSMYDSRVARAKPPRWLKDTEQVKLATRYYNAVLAFYGTWLRDETTHRGMGYVDMLAPLGQITTQVRLKEPDFTVIPDAVHPDANGQAIMAFAILEQMNSQRGVSAVTANLTKGKWRVSAGKTGKVTEMAGDENGVSFTFEANALPWVLPPDAARGYELTKAGHKMSNERLVVRGLKPGKYELKIDGVAVGQYTHAQLGAKIELQSNDKTPQYQQALKVAMLNKDRNEKAVRPYRNQYSRLKGQQSKEVDKKDPAAFAKFMEKFDAELVKLKAMSKEYENKIYAANQPVARKYEISQVE